MKSIGNKRFAFYALHFAFAVLAAHETNAALPSGYTELEYLRSSGAQYIDTGVVPKATTRVVCDFRLTVMPSDRVRCGWASKGNKEAFWFGTDNGPTNFSASVCGNSVQANTGVPVDTTRHTFDISMSAVKFDDATVTNPGAAFTDAAIGNTMYLFASRQEWDPNIGAYGSMEIYSCQIYVGTTLTRDFVPAVRLSDGAAGLYETVNGDFYENQGLGDFSAGPAKSADYYVAVEYIESDGDQYIDTLFTLGSNHVSTIEVQPTELPTINGTDTGGIMTYYGCRTGASSKNVSFFLEYGSGQPKFTLDFNDSAWATYRLQASGASTAYRYVIIDSAASRSATWYDASGTFVSAASDTGHCADAFLCAGTAYLFAVNDMSGSSPTPLWNKAKMKFYGGTVTTADDGTPCCNLVPCLRNGTEPGVYDTVRDIFLANAGSGTFTFGEETGVVYGEVSGTFVASSIPSQTVSSFAELFAGVEPSVTVSNLTTETELVLGTDYTVSYSGNTAIGTAYAVITGRGAYDGKTVLVPFAITGFTAYYAVSGGSDAADTSSVSGATKGNNAPTGWSTTKGGAKAVNGITAPSSIYYIWANRWMRTPYASSHATPVTSAIVVEPGCVWTLGVKMTGQTLTLNNVLIRVGGAVNVIPINDAGDIQNNTFAGSYMLEEGATLRLDARQNPGAIKQSILSASVTGRGAIVLPSSADTIAYAGVLENKITGDISGFTGDIGTWRGNDLAAVSMELVNAASIPGDPEPADVAYVVVTNGATLKIDQDWVSPTNRIWILGDGATPTINVPSGKTVTINGDLVGSVGFNKTGTGTLVLKGASPDFSGTVTISGGEIRLAGKAAQLSTAPGVTWVEDGGTYVVASLTVYPVADQTVYDLATLAAGVCPSVTVSNLESMVELKVGTDYTVSYSNNTAYGQATATVTGIGDYAGTVRDITFNIHLVKQITANYALSADEDWTDFESIDVASGAVIDLNGNDLTISGLDGAGEITDSAVVGGSLVFDVPAVFTSGYEAAITGVSLTGNLKLVKKGEGLLKAAKTGQTYTGGNDILGGVLRAAAKADMTGGYLGPNTSAAKCPIYIGPGGILDPAGSYFWGNHTIVLNGGMISNTVEQTSNMFNPTLVVTADSTFATEQSYFWQSPTVNLDGHTLSLWIAATGRTLDFRTVLTNGTLDAVLGGYLKSGTSISSPTLDIRINTALDMASTWSVHDYKSTYGNYGKNSGALSVYGTFTPESEYFYGPTMQDGSAIDLSAKTGAWNVKSSLTNGGGNPTTKFASGATVAILLGSRTPAMDERIVSWTPEVRPASSVSFTNETYVFRYGNYGIYVDSPRTFNPTFLPDIASARLASDVEAAIEASLSVTNLVTGETLALRSDYTYSYTIDHGVCTVTVTGKGDNAGVSIVRKFAIGEIGFKASDYTYAMDIVPTVGKVTAPLTNFPVLVRLSAAKLGAAAYGKCKSDELRFALADGTLLAHEVDYWNANGESTVWVNVPEFTSNTVIRACWGFKPGKEPLARPFDEAWTDYVGVWHFSEESGSARDSSGNGYHTTDGSGTVSNLDAKVGLSRNVNKTSLATSVSNLASTGNKKPLTTVSKFTASGWMLSTLDIGVGSNAKYPQMMRNKSNWSDGYGWFAGYEGTSVAFNAVGSGDTRTIFDFPKSVYNNWVYITAVFNDSSCILYEDGAFVTNCAINAVKANTSYALRFGQDLTGRIDEFRIHDGVQSAAYAAADYATQTDADFLSYGEVKSSGGFFILVR